MVISVKDCLHNPGKRISVSGEIKFEAIDFNGKINFVRPVFLNGEIFAIGEDVVFEGRADALLEFECGRCLDTFTKNILINMEEVFSSTKENDEAYEISAGDFIEFDQPVLNSLLLNIPISRICKEDCKGLCSKCGINKNHQDCDCSDIEIKDNPFAVLLDGIDNREV